MRHSCRFNWSRGVVRYAPTLVLLLAACAPATIPPTETATVVHPPTVTETLEPTATKGPIYTPTITSTSRPTSTSLPVPYPERHCGPFSFSPYGKWVAWMVCPLERNGYPQLRVENFDQTIIWVADFDFESINLDGGFDPVKWSEDGKYLYFRIMSGGDGAYSFDFADYLLQMDLANGESIELVSYQEYSWFAYSFSSKKNAYVYIPSIGPNLDVFVHDLSTGTEQKITLGSYSDLDPGNIIWSPDGNQIVFGVEKYNPYAVEIFLVDLLSRSGKSIVEIDYARARPIEWLSELEVVLDLGGGNGILNVQTGEIIIPTTPQP